MYILQNVILPSDVKANVEAPEKQTTVNNTSPRILFTTFLFSSQLRNPPNKLERHIEWGWKGLQGTNTLVYWAHV
jgi:hypothetical protein